MNDSQTELQTELRIENPCRYPEAGARRVRPWIEPMLAELAPEASSLGLRFVSDREMRRINRTYRQKDSSTDVLSFPGEQEDLPPGIPQEEAGGHLGDILVAIPTARRQAIEGGHSVERELRILLLHGVLHCLGYDHETDDGTMERLEKRLRLRWIPDQP